MKDTKKQKKKFYQKWWFWILVIIIAISNFANSDNEISKDIRQKGEEVTNVQPTSTPTPTTAPPTVEPQTEITIIGSDKENVRKILNGYKEKTSIMGENAIDFDSDNLLVTVFFNNEKADGVIFLSNNLNSMNTTTGEGSYVSKHYDELVKMATNNTNIKIESDLTKFNSQGKKKVASELYIGNTPYNDTTNTTTQNTTTPETKVNTSSDSEFESLVFLNVGVKVYRYKDENSYLGTIKMVDRDYKDENGKKVGAVYLEGGEVEGWYHRRDLVSNCYIRSDDPHKMGY